MDKADGMAVALYQAFLLSGRVKRKGKKKWIWRKPMQP
jgi:hypothetical protein